jgi:hypothetical protein
MAQVVEAGKVQVQAISELHALVRAQGEQIRELREKLGRDADGRDGAEDRMD